MNTCWSGGCGRVIRLQSRAIDKKCLTPYSSQPLAGSVYLVWSDSDDRLFALYNVLSGSPLTLAGTVKFSSQTFLFCLTARQVSVKLNGRKFTSTRRVVCDPSVIMTGSVLTSRSVLLPRQQIYNHSLDVLPTGWFDFHYYLQLSRFWLDSIFYIYIDFYGQTLAYSQK